MSDCIHGYTYGGCRECSRLLNKKNELWSDVSDIEKEVIILKTKLDFYQKDSAAAWNKCEEYRVYLEKLRSALQKIDGHMKYQHYTHVGCFQFVAQEALKIPKPGDRE